MTILKSANKYPAMTDFINNDGRLEIGYIDQLGVSAIAVDEGGTVWEGKKSYESLEAALEDAEQGISEWIAENY
ncbi:MAG: hypothetical protein ACK58N_10065 [Synechocystis sp.]|jgi:hypothetical protein